MSLSYVSNESTAFAVAADVKDLGCRALPVRADSADADQIRSFFAEIDRECLVASMCW